MISSASNHRATETGSFDHQIFGRIRFHRYLVSHSDIHLYCLEHQVHLLCLVVLDGRQQPAQPLANVRKVDVNLCKIFESNKLSKTVVRLFGVSIETLSDILLDYAGWVVEDCAVFCGRRHSDECREFDIKSQ